MTQRIFDTDNADDMALLWSILPDDALKICKDVMGCQVWENRKENGYTLEMLKINWHDKNEITRPIQEATRADIGKLCKFWDDDERYAFGVLSMIDNGKNDNYKMSYAGFWEHCRRLTKQEIEELC